MECAWGTDIAELTDVPANVASVVNMSVGFAACADAIVDVAGVLKSIAAVDAPLGLYADESWDVDVIFVTVDEVRAGVDVKRGKFCAGILCSTVVPAAAGE